MSTWGDCQNYGPFLGPYFNTGPNTGPNLGDPKRDHNFDNPPLELRVGESHLAQMRNQALSMFGCTRVKIRQGQKGWSGLVSAFAKRDMLKRR